MKKLWFRNRKAETSSVLLALMGLLSQPTLGQESSSGHDKTLIQVCKSEDRDLTDRECALWAKRADYVQKSSCPDAAAKVACSSFREMFDAYDVDLIDDFIRQTKHIYICFRPKEDLFFEAYYSDPNDGVWQKDDGLLNATHSGGAGVTFYKGGVGSSDMSFHNSGKWSFGVSRKIDVESISAAPSDAIFSGDKISIEGSHFEAKESYKSPSDQDLLHVITIQLSTGRFSESYDLKSGKNLNSYSGRCLVIPFQANH